MELKSAMFENDKSLKSKNRWLLYAYILFHFLIFITVVLGAEGVTSLWIDLTSDWTSSILPIGIVYFFVSLISLILLGVFPSHLRDRLVHLRWSHPLPGARAFTKYAIRDARVNVKALEKKYGGLPTDPVVQNHTWYKASIEHRNHLGVLDAHRTYLAARDIATISWIFVLTLPLASYFLKHEIVISSLYGIGLILTAILLSLATKIYGGRFVENVLAVTSNLPKGAN